MTESDPGATCAWVRDRIEAYLDGDLTANDVSKIASHLSGCDGCADELALATRLREDLRNLPRRRCPDKVVEAVLGHAEKGFRGKEGSRRPVGFSPRHRRFWYPAAAAAAAAVIALVAGVWLLHRPQKRAPTPSSDELARAEEQVKWTLGYIGVIGHRSAFAVRDDVIGPRVVCPLENVLDTIIDKGMALQEHHAR